MGGFLAHLAHEWVLLANLLGLLLGFALLSKHFESSRVPAVLPRYLPDDWKGGFVLLVMIFVLSSFLDNIAAALIGGTIANVVFRGKVHIGYLAAIVAASNAGGSGSVVGDTTTTMMWIAGVDPLQVFDAYIAAGLAVLIFGIPAALQQHRYSPISKDAPPNVHVDWMRVAIVASDTCHGDRRQRRRQHAFQRTLRPIPVHRRCGLGGHSRLRPAAPSALGGNAGRVSRQHLSAVAGAFRVDDAGAQAARCVLAGGARTGIRVGCVRQHSPHGTRAEARRLRLGLPGLRRRLRRLDDLVRLVGRRRAGQPVPGRTFRGRMGARRMARCAGLRHRALRSCSRSSAGIRIPTWANRPKSPPRRRWSCLP